MIRVPPRTLTVVIDSRERTNRLRLPPTFKWYAPRCSWPVLVQVQECEDTLETGDYAVFRGDTCVAALEHKASMEELRGNLLTADHRRLVREWERMQRIPYRGVLLSFHDSHLRQVSTYVPQPLQVWDALQNDCARYQLDLLVATPSKRQPCWPGEVACRWLLSRLTRYLELEDQHAIARIRRAPLSPQGESARPESRQQAAAKEGAPPKLRVLARR